MKNIAAQHRRQKHDYIDANQELTADPRRSSPSLPHLIGNKNVFLAHFYTTNARMKLGSCKEPQPSRVLYIGPSKILNDYYAPRAKYIESGKGRVAGSDAARRIDPSVFNCLRRNLHDGATCITQRCKATSLQARLGNPSQTCLHAKQAARSRRVSLADLPPLILWRNRQTEAHLVFRPKTRNRRGDFEVQITKSKLPVLRSKPENPPPPWF
jgi:hypothetical protein